MTERAIVATIVGMGKLTKTQRETQIREIEKIIKLLGGNQALADRMTEISGEYVPAQYIRESINKGLPAHRALPMYLAANNPGSIKLHRLEPRLYPLKYVKPVLI